MFAENMTGSPVFTRTPFVGESFTSTEEKYNAAIGNVTKQALFDAPPSPAYA